MSWLASVALAARSSALTVSFVTWIMYLKTEDRQRLKGYWRTTTRPFVRGKAEVKRVLAHY